MKELIKNLLKLSPIALSKNHLYDKQTTRIIKQVLKKDSNCIDVGCHKGEILDLLLKAAPSGRHFGFEPIPHMYKNLSEKYADKPNCHIHEVALSNKTGSATFNYVISNPSYSGLKKRKYDKANEEDTQIEVKTELLDNIIPKDLKIDLIKIDVEGGELLVLEGAKQTIDREKPVVVFEHGLGASEFYDANPEKVFNYFQAVKMNISTLSNFLKEKGPLSQQAFSDQFYNRENYYFIAYK